MPAAWIGAAAAVAGTANSIASSPGSSGSQSYYTPTGLQNADQQWQQIQNQNVQGYLGRDLNQYGLQSLYAQLNAQNQYGGAYQQAANNAGGIYNQQANYAGAAANQLNNQAQGAYGAENYLQGAGQQLWQTAQDPQNALYGRTVQQLQDQTGATNSMYGLGSSAAGAGVANQALSNFNIDWQNNQLQRQATGLQGLTGAYGAAGQYGQFGNASQQGAYDMLGNSASSALQAGSTPYGVAQQIAGLPGQAGSTYGQYLNQNVYGPGQAIQQSAIPYLNYGQGSQQVAYQNQTQAAGAAGALGQQAINGLGTAAQNSGYLQNLFGGSGQQGYFGSTQSPNDYSGTGYGGYGQGSSGYYSGGGNTYGFTS